MFRFTFVTMIGRTNGFAHKRIKNAQLKRNPREEGGGGGERKLKKSRRKYTHKKWGY